MEFAAALADLSEVPDDLLCYVRPGWQTFRLTGTGDVEFRPQWERVGTVSYPELFEVVVGEKDRSRGFTCVLGFQFWKGQPELVGAMSWGAETHVALDRVFSAKPLQFWKRRALLMLAAWGANSEGVSGLDAIDQLLTPEGAAEAWGRVRSALEVSTSSRKDRVTPEVLAEVAEVYRTAWKAGRNPTKTVAEHFHKSHSTAARWVGQARKIGALGPANGSLGGEIDPEEGS